MTEKSPDKPKETKRKSGSRLGVAKKQVRDKLFRPDPKIIEAAKEAKETKPAEPEVVLPTAADRVDDIFEVAAPTRTKDMPKALGGKEKRRYEAELLRVEWAVKYPTLAPYKFLMEVKGFSLGQAEHIVVDICGGQDTWYSEKAKILDKITESVAKRHIDLIAEVQEQHISASKLGLAKAVEMLAKGVQVRFKSKGKDGTMVFGEPVSLPLRSVDIMNCVTAIEKAQQIYRRSLGLPNEEAGLAQILEKVQQLQRPEQHLHLHAAPVDAPKSATAEAMQTLSYDEIKEFIEYRREMKRRAQQALDAPAEKKSD